MNQEQNCPCGSDAAFAQCCGPFLDGSRLPATAEALMRSRYCAYTRFDDKYLLDTWLPATRPEDEHPSDDGDGTAWTGLEVRRTEAGGVDDQEGIVEFVAFCDIAGQPAQLHETSTFQRVGDRWFYVDGEGPSPLRRSQPKVGRNDPCLCGSGKKYKKCCGS